MELISLKSIYKIYNVGGEEVRALDGVDLSINNNEYLSIMGPSGSGKSTMMNMIGCLDSPSSGLYEFEGEKYAIVKPVDTGLSSENYYAVNTGVDLGDIIVTGRYRVLSKELQHGMKVSFKIESNSY